MWARWSAGTQGEVDASKRREAGGREEGEEEEEESAMDYHRSKGSLPGGKVVAAGCKGVQMHS